MCFIILLFMPLGCACREIHDQKSDSMQTGADQTILYFPLLKGKAIGLVANRTSRIGRTHLVDTMLSSGISLKKIFAPEHGFRGDADAGAEIDNTVDPKTGLPIVSLYGSRTKPDPDDLEGIDIMIYDIQDVGVRFYTYISTLHYIMEACAQNHMPLLVLDRPDPLGHYVDGPVLDPAFKSFVGLHPIPVVYGMTVGELARMINGEGWLDGSLKCDLMVVPCSNYDHNSFYVLPVDPSPNLNSMEAVYLYPSLCFFEGTIMSLGRGTPFPFRVVGHPEYPVKNFSFTPETTSSNKNPVHKDKTCYGIDLRTMDIEQLKKMHAINLQWLINVYRTMGEGESFFTGYIDKLAGTGELKKQIIAGWSEERIKERWQADLTSFMAVRKKYLLYRDFGSDSLNQKK
jgi:uncharacterized protein YbbC (DUF1343 family)